MTALLHTQIQTLRKYQAWRTGKDTRTMDEAGIVPAAITSALDAVLEIAERHLRDATNPAEPSGYAYRYHDHSGGTVLRFNSGKEVNVARPIEAVPYWFAPPNATTVTCQPYGHPMKTCAECNHEHATKACNMQPSEPASVPSDDLETLRMLRAEYDPSNGPMSTLKADALDAAIEAMESYGHATLPAEPVSVPSMRELIADDAYAATFQSVGQYRKALLAKYGQNTTCCNNPSQCWEPCGELGNSLDHAAVAPKGVNSIPPLDVESDALTAAYMAGLEDGKKHNRTDAAHYRFLRSMPMGIKILTQVAPGEWEEILSGDELDGFLKEYPR